MTPFAGFCAKFVQKNLYISIAAKSPRCQFANFYSSDSGNFKGLQATKFGFAFF
jgi:hypothetical protein